MNLKRNQPKQAPNQKQKTGKNQDKTVEVVEDVSNETSDEEEFFCSTRNRSKQNRK